MTSIVSGAIDVTTLHTATVGISGLESVLKSLGSGSSTETKVLVDPRI